MLSVAAGDVDQKSDRRWNLSQEGLPEGGDSLNCSKVSFIYLPSQVLPRQLVAHRLCKPYTQLSLVFGPLINLEEETDRFTMATGITM